MLASIPGFLRTPLVVLLIVLSTIVHTTPLFLVMRVPDNGGHPAARPG